MSDIFSARLILGADLQKCFDTLVTFQGKKMKFLDEGYIDAVGEI